MEEVEKERYSSVELLRIIAMIFIIFHHMAMHGYGVLLSEYVLPEGASEHYIRNILMLRNCAWPGKLGVGIFMLITGWYYKDKDGQPAWKKLIKLYGVYFFYNAIDITFRALRGFPISWTNYLPFYSRANWYINGFLICMLIMPVLINGLDSLSQENHKRLAILLFILDLLPWRWDINFWEFTTAVPIDAAEMIAFIVIARYLRKYRPKFVDNKALLATVFFGTLAIITAVIYICYPIVYANGYDQEKWYLITDNTACLYPFMSISFFLLLRKAKIPVNKGINYCAGIIPALYMMHDNTLVREPLWSLIMPYMPTPDESTISIILAALALFVIFFAMAQIFEWIRIPFAKLGKRVFRGILSE